MNSRALMWGAATGLALLLGLWPLVLCVWAPVVFWWLWGRQLDAWLSTFAGVRRERTEEEQLEELLRNLTVERGQDGRRSVRYHPPE